MKRISSRPIFISNHDCTSAQPQSRRRRRKQSESLVEKPPAKVASPPCPEPHLKPQKKAIVMTPSSSLTCAPSASISTIPPAISSQNDSVRPARKCRSGGCLPGDVSEVTKRQKTSSPRLPDPAVQDACKLFRKLFLSIDFSKAWVDAVHLF